MSRNINVLLIEDNPGDARLVREALKETADPCYRVEWVRLLSLGLDRLDDGGIDVLLLDLGLPDSQGLATLAAVHAAAPHMPVVVLSGAVDEQFAVEAVQASAQDYLVKTYANRHVLTRSLRYAIERKRGEEALRVARVLTMGELAASIAHEVNQPLAAVVTNAEAALRWLAADPPNLEEVRDALSRISRDGNRASQVIGRIRAFLKKGDGQAARLDINEAIQDAVTIARGELVKSRVALRLDLSSPLPPVVGDRIQLQQVVLNLVMNGSESMSSTAMSSAADASRELLVTSRHVTGPEGHPAVLVAVRDSGAGVKPEDANRMFDAFFTTKATGMGMGLSISRSIVEDHGGNLWATPNQGPGLTVQFTLPAERGNPS
jgi:C4-dicarboxylate-specific signal transduction histidine kinase